MGSVVLREFYDEIREGDQVKITYTGEQTAKNGQHLSRLQHGADLVTEQMLEPGIAPVQRWGFACDPRKRCVAKNARNKRCGNPPIVGQAVCPMHLHEAIEIEDAPAPGFFRALPTKQ